MSILSSPNHPLETQSPAGEQVAQLRLQEVGGQGCPTKKGRGQRELPQGDSSPAPPPSCRRFHVNISAFRTSNLSRMTGQIWLHREHSSNKVSSGTSAKKTSKLLSPHAVTVG